MSFSDYQSWLGILAGLIGFGVAVATYFRGVIHQNQKIHALELELATTKHTLILELTTVKTRFDVFWTVIEKELPKVLIKPHRKDIDELLKKMQSREGLTEQEKMAMKEKMREALNEGISDVDSGLALGYALLIARIESEQAVKNK